MTTAQIEELVLEDLLAEAGLIPTEETIEAASVPAKPEPPEVIEELVVEEATPNPAETIEASEVTAEPAKKPKPEKKEKKPAAEKVKKEAKPKPEKKAAEKPAGEEKAKVPRVHHEHRHELLSSRMGADLSGYLVLELADAELDADALKEKQDEVFAMVKESGTKVQSRMSNILEFAGGKIATLNPVIDQCFRLLAADGSLEVSDKGKLQETLRGKYSAASAKSMGNNSVAAMHKLKVLNKDTAGKYSLNPQSLIYAKISSMLGL